MSEETPAERALMAERHDDGDGRNATWHMSVNRMGSMLAAIRSQALTEPSAEADAALVKAAMDSLVYLSDRYGHSVEDDGEDNWARFMALQAVVDRIRALSRPATPPLDVERLARAEAIVEMARLVSQWHDSIGSGPIEELNAELGELQRAVREYNDPFSVPIYAALANPAPETTS
jgi:hypothetical protein